MEVVPVKIYPRGFGETERRDWWWLDAIIVVVVFSSFLGYGFWAAIQNEHFEYGPYLSPFYAPLLWGDSAHSWFGPRPEWWPVALVLQNVHRYFAYLAVVFIVLLSYDVWLALWFTDPVTGATSFGVGVGTLVMLVNVVLIALYTFGCHSLRHLVGGRRDEISRSSVSQACYNCTSALNSRHMLFAWCSLFSVGLTDAYIRLCSMGVLTDYRIL
jgi:hypothetical protein